MRRSTGLTLMELLVVVLIIALLVALLLPVVSASRNRARTTACMSNMRQLVSALLMYRQDNGAFPPFAQSVFPYTKSREVFLCPLDYAVEWGGANHIGGRNPYARDNRIALSYFYFADPVNYDGSSYKDLIRLLPEKDPNHGLIACVLHGTPIDPGCRNYNPPIVENCFEGTTLRARIDGSVQRAHTTMCYYIDPSDGALTGVLYRWYLFTDEPCPPEVCPYPCTEQRP
ncbi:MAG: DUF1559 family PulG-like putative transporter [Fimbriimonadales bacterium]